MKALPAISANSSHADSLRARLRCDWTREEVRAIYHQPLLELVFNAQQIHRQYHDPAQVQLSISIEDAVATHQRVVGPAQRLDALASVCEVITASETPRQTTAVVRTSAPLLDPAWEVHPVTLEEIVLAYLAQSRVQDARRRAAA